MKKYFSYLLLLLLFFTQSVKAHQTEVSTTMLVENENNTWVLQISASLTAFQKEIRMHYAETPYKTPEEFKQMVLEYVKRNLQIEFNNKQSITLGEGVVKLGHETKVAFEVYGVPETINSVLVKNETFKDIHRNQSALVILKEGVERKQFVLNTDNNHLINLELDGNTFQRVEEQNISASSINIILIILGLIVFGFIAQKVLARQKLKGQNNY